MILEYDNEMVMVKMILVVSYYEFRNTVKPGWSLKWPFKTGVFYSSLLTANQSNSGRHKFI